MEITLSEAKRETLMIKPLHILNKEASRSLITPVCLSDVGLASFLLPRYKWGYVPCIIDNRLIRLEIQQVFNP